MSKKKGGGPTKIKVGPPQNLDLGTPMTPKNIVSQLLQYNISILELAKLHELTCGCKWALKSFLELLNTIMNKE